VTEPYTEKVMLMERQIRALLAGLLITTAAGASAATDTFVWVPEKDADGRILPQSIAKLAPNSWYEVGDTSLQPLKQKIETAMGKSYRALSLGNEDLHSTFNAWVSGDLGDDGKFYIPWGGGHGATAMNGIWALDIERMGGDSTWTIEQLPSDPDKPGLEWSAEYRKSKNFTNYRPALAFPADILPDGMPTSRHQYNGVWFDKKRKTINQSRGHLWSFDTVKKETIGKVWRVKDKDRYPSIYGNLWYNEFHDTVVGHLRYDKYGRFDHIRYHPATHEVELHGGLPWNFMGSTCGTRYGDKILYLGSDSGSARWATYDLQAEKMRSGKFKGVSFDYRNEMPACVYIPAWDKVLRRMQDPKMQGKWLTFDPNNKTEGDYAPAGRPPPYDRYPGKKVFYYPPWKSVIYITARNVDSNAVFVMRTE